MKAGNHRRSDYNPERDPPRHLFPVKLRIDFGTWIAEPSCITECLELHSAAEAATKQRNRPAFPTDGRDISKGKPMSEEGLLNSIAREATTQYRTESDRMLDSTDVEDDNVR